MIKGPYLEVCTDLWNMTRNGNMQTGSSMSNSEWITSQLLSGQCVNMCGVWPESGLLNPIKKEFNESGIFAL
jgi:hypothetical protein